jgi:hypothetical protein
MTDATARVASPPRARLTASEEIFGVMTGTKGRQLRALPDKLRALAGRSTPD